MPSAPPPVRETPQSRSAPRDWRRSIVWIASVATGLAAMALLIAKRDRIRMHGQESTCRAGDAETCLRVATTYLQGERVRQDLELGNAFEQEGLAILGTQCERPDRDACFRLGTVLMSNAPSAKRRGRAAHAFVRACDAGLAQACVKAAALYVHGFQGRDRSRDDEEADARKRAELLDKGCRTGELEACSDLVQVRRSEGNAGDMVRVFAIACGLGSGTACFEASEYLHGGRGVEVDLRRSHELAKRALPPLEKACAAERDQAEEHRNTDQHPCHLLAVLLDTGRGGTRNIARVFELWKTACEEECSSACMAIGGSRGFGRLHYDGIPQSRAAGRRACAEGNGWACAGEAAKIMSEGNDVSGDPSAAADFQRLATKHFRTACERDQVHGCEALGERLRVGLGAERDVAAAQAAYEKAERLLRGACDRGRASECSELAKMYAKGGPVAADPRTATGLYERARKLFNEGCDRKGPKAEVASDCTSLAYLCGEGVVVPKDEACQMRALERCCDLSSRERGSDSCCRDLAWHRQNSTARPQ